MATKATESRKPITEPNDLKKPRNQTAKTLASNKSIHKKANNIVRTKNTSSKSSRCSPLSISLWIRTKNTCDGAKTNTGD